MKNEKNRRGKNKSVEQGRRALATMHVKEEAWNRVLAYYGIISTFLSHHVGPYLHDIGDKVIHELTNQEGDKQWTALTPSNRWSRYTIWILVSVAGFGIVWAMLARIDETVQASGKLEPIGTTLDIKAPIGGVIKSILVKDGELVTKGQILVELDTTAAKAKLTALVNVRDRTLVDLLVSKSQIGIKIDESQLNNVQSIRLRSLKDELKSRLASSQSEVSSAEEQVKSSLAQLEAKKRALGIREQILADIEPLAKVGGISRSQYLKELQEIEILRGELKSLKASAEMAAQKVLSAKSRLVNTRSLSLIDFTGKIEEAEKQLSQLENQISEVRVTLKYQALRAPKAGIVFDLQANSAGYVANNERPILKIVPTDNLVARVFIQNTDIGFVRVGQPSKIRVDAYPYNEFGEITGSIASIGSDVLEPDDKNNSYRFPVTIDLSKDNISYKGKSLPLISGMSVNAIVILRQRPVIAIFTQKLLPFWDSLEKL